MDRLFEPVEPVEPGHNVPRTELFNAPCSLGSIIVPEPRLTPLDGLLLNNPHNPTGALFQAESLRSLLDQGALVVVDEAFMDFLLPGQQQSLVSWVPDYPNLVILRSLTKFYSLAGLRLGYALLHPDRAQKWQQWRDPWPVNQLAAIAAEVGLRDRNFQQRTWEWLSQAKPPLVSALQALPGLEVYPGAANFLLVRSQHSVVQLQTQLLKKYRILIRDCLSFPELDDRFFRIAVRHPGENQRLVEAIAFILASNPGPDCFGPACSGADCSIGYPEAHSPPQGADASWESLSELRGAL